MPWTRSRNLPRPHFSIWIGLPRSQSRRPESIYYGDWLIRRMFAWVPAQAVIARWLTTFKDFPPRSKPASFSVSDAMEKIQAQASKN